MPVAYFSCKMAMSQQNYTTLEKEKPSIIATLKEFIEVYSSKDIHVFMEHKNLMFDTLKTQCVLCWNTKIEQFSPLDVIGPLQYSSQQLFKAQLPGYSSSNHRREETRRTRRGFQQRKRWSVFLGSRILLSLWWWSLGMYWVSSQLTLSFTSRSKSIELCSHLWIAAAGGRTTCSTSK